MDATDFKKRWHTREDSGLRLDREGRWFHDGEPLDHPKIVEAFNQGLQPTEDGRYRLSFGNDWCFVEVEDAAYRVTALDVVDGKLRVRLSDRTGEPLALETLKPDETGVLCCRVKQGRALARFTRDAQYALGALMELEPGSDERLVLRVGGQTVPLAFTLSELKRNP